MHTLQLAGWSPATPLRSLMAWLSGTLPPTPVPVAPPGRSTSVAPACMARSRLTERRNRPLRVLRVLDGPQERSAAGRMVISGRLADVCAELDRLAALDAG